MFELHLFHIHMLLSIGVFYIIASMNIINNRTLKHKLIWIKVIPTIHWYIRMGITLWMNFHLKTLFFIAAFHWIVRIRRFELRNDVSAILFELSLKCYFVSSNDEGSENVSCFGDCSNTLIRICLFHWSCPKQCRLFSLLILLDAHQFWNRISWPNDRKHSTRVVFYFMFGICRKITNSFVWLSFLSPFEYDWHSLSLSLLNSWMLHSTWNWLSLCLWNYSKSKDKTKTMFQLEFYKAKSNKLAN